jgi:transposase
METCLFFPSIFAVCDSHVCEQSIQLRLMSNSEIGMCPLCQQPSFCVHSHYLCQVADLTISGKSVRLFIQARKFFCEYASCARKIFTERWGDNYPISED